MTITTPPPLGTISASQWGQKVVNDLTDLDTRVSNTIKGVIARWRRTTPSPTTTTIAGAVRIDGIPVIAGRSYRINTGGLVPNSTVAGDDVEAHIRYRTGGGAATTADPILPGSPVRGRYGAGLNTPIIPLSAPYVATATTTLSLLLCATRGAGSGAVNLYADGTYAIELWVEDTAVAPALSGVNI